MISLGIDIGSVSVKLAVVDCDRLVTTAYRRFSGSPFEVLYDLLKEIDGNIAGQPFRLGMTGIGGKTAQSILGGDFYGEIASLAAGNYLIAPKIRTVIEMGGEDSKLLILDPDQQVVVDFAMNAQCAAGTGSFLDQQAGRLKISIEGEFGELALKSKNPPRIAGRCSVFAKSDMIHLQQIATPDYDIVAGLCFAVARNFKSSIARGKQFQKPIAFEGGVAANPGMVRAFTEVLNLAPGELLIPEYFNVVGAIGAARLAAERSEPVTDFDREKITGYLKYRHRPEAAREALSFDCPDTKHYDTTLADRPTDIDGLEVFLGIDVGSLSTNLVLIDRDQRVIARRYLMTEGRPIEAVRRGLAEIGGEVGDRVKVMAVGTTGSGRYLTGDFVGADIVRNEITAQATAAVAIDPGVDTIFEIGGQDSKYISIDDRAVIDFEMNKACAAGTGSFLQEQAEKLNIHIENEFGERALKAECPVGCGERCTVFMESDLVAHQRKGASIDDLTAGLAYSIASNYLTKVVGDRRIGNHIFFQGGVAWNKAVVAAFEKLIGKTITVPPHHDVTGAIGAAILAVEQLDNPDFVTKFRGFDLYKRKYTIETFRCEDCSNQCEIRRVDVEGEEPLFYGSRCEKYDVGRTANVDKQPDYVKLRQKLLYKRWIPVKKSKKAKRARIGLPRVLHFHDYYPFWQAFFDSLNFQVVNSDISNRRITEDALEMFQAETCYPVKMVYGHVANLFEKKVDYIFLPSMIKVAEEQQEVDKAGYICPYVQSIGSQIKSRFGEVHDGTRLITHPISLCESVSDLRQRFKPLAHDLGIRDKELRRAIDAGIKAYKLYKQALHTEGDRILAGIGPDEKAMVVVSRPYNGYDPKLSLELPKKIRELGYKAIPLDFFRLKENEEDFPYMYWKYGRRILEAARMLRRSPNLFPVYITSFGCGPDSFITHFFRREMAGKPYLQLELDEHSADAGLITRCEAFADSLRFYKYQPPIADFHIEQDDFRPFERTIYIPNMCDHAHVMRAAMCRYGLNAEVMPEPDEKTLEYGKKFTSGKECFPCVITTGDMIKMVLSKGFQRKKTIFLMPGADGPCRFGLYNEYHRVILDELGFKDVPVFSPNSRTGYDSFGLEGTDFRTIAWRGLVYMDCLIKLLLQTRPYEINPGQTEEVYIDQRRRLENAIIADDPLEELASQCARAFKAIPTTVEARPLVGVVGEIYLRNNRFSNNHLITKLEALGLEVRLATFTEWPMYTSAEYRRDSFIRRDFKGVLKGHLQLIVQHHHENKIIKAFTREVPLGHEFPVEQVLKLAGPYLPRACKGEALLSIGKSIEMAQTGVSGIVNAMPFNCMPGTVVTSLSGKVASDMGSIPWLNISYEGLRDSGEETRLEAFAEQVGNFAAAHGGINRNVRRDIDLVDQIH
ncbi:MAG TPA: acyl-CoA dehydratase activase [candidate division Zixibacteria bacterium]|nr:acyl-CoA dehydratase activase [candidate division Zixibacteria bacterium]